MSTMPTPGDVFIDHAGERFVVIDNSSGLVWTLDKSDTTMGFELGVDDEGGTWEPGPPAARDPQVGDTLTLPDGYVATVRRRGRDHGGLGREDHLTVYARGVTRPWDLNTWRGYRLRPEAIYTRCETPDVSDAAPWAEPVVDDAEAATEVLEDTHESSNDFDTDPWDRP